MVCQGDKTHRKSRESLLNQPPGFNIIPSQSGQVFYDMNIMELERDKLANAEDIVIDTGKSVESRVRSFMEQTGNPFALNVGEYILQLGFAEGTEDFHVFPCSGKRRNAAIRSLSIK